MGYAKPDVPLPFKEDNDFDSLNNNFVDRGLVTCTPSLANLVSQVLCRSLRQEGAPHDCEQDAAAAMQLVNHALRHGVPAGMQAPQIKVCPVSASFCMHLPLMSTKCASGFPPKGMHLPRLCCNRTSKKVSAMPVDDCFAAWQFLSTALQISSCI